jgi:hypothetical protein
MDLEVSTENQNSINPNSHNLDSHKFITKHPSQNIDHTKKSMNAANRNNNNVDDIVVVHKIPKWPPAGGMAPMVQLSIMAGQYNRTTQPELKRHFEKQRLLAAAMKNAKTRGVAVIHPDE